MSTDILRGASLDSMTVTLWLRRNYTYILLGQIMVIEVVETQLSQNVIFEVMNKGIQSELSK